MNDGTKAAVLCAMLFTIVQFYLFRLMSAECRNTVWTCFVAVVSSYSVNCKLLNNMQLERLHTAGDGSATEC